MFDSRDIRSEHRRATRGSGVADYQRMGLYGRRDDSGEGVEGHTAKLRRERDAAFSLSDVGDRSKNHTGKLRWE